jgi:hypothetical protein
MHDGGFVGDPRHDIRLSRWRGTDTTFGPVGRLGITGAMVGFLVAGIAMMGISPFGLWFFLGWSVLAGYVFRQIWAPVRVEGSLRGPRAAIARRFPRAARPLPWGIVGGVAGAMALAALGAAWIEGDTLLRYGIVLLVGTVLLVIALLKLTEW